MAKAKGIGDSGFPIRKRVSRAARKSEDESLTELRRAARNAEGHLDWVNAPHLQKTGDYLDKAEGCLAIAARELSSFEQAGVRQGKQPEVAALKARVEAVAEQTRKVRSDFESKLRQFEASIKQISEGLCVAYGIEPHRLSLVAGSRNIDADEVPRRLAHGENIELLVDGTPLENLNQSRIDGVRDRVARMTQAAVQLAQEISDEAQRRLLLEGVLRATRGGWVLRPEGPAFLVALHNKETASLEHFSPVVRMNGKYGSTEEVMDDWRQFSSLDEARAWFKDRNYGNELDIR